MKGRSMRLILVVASIMVIAGGALTLRLHTSGGDASASGTGGQLSMGAPLHLGGDVVVPILATASSTEFSGFNIHVLFDNSMFSFNPSSGFQSGGVLESSGATSFCLAVVTDGGHGITGTCNIVGTGSTTSGGTLATITLIPTATGCSNLHLFTYGPPDGGTSTTGTYTIDAATTTVQSNSYGVIDINSCAMPAIHPVSAYEADVNHDGVVNVLDLAAVANHYLESVPLPTPTP